MARGRSSNSATIPGKYNFVNVDFSYTERATINDWIETRELSTDQLIVDIVEGGFKLSISEDKRDGVHIITLTDKRVVKGRREAPIYMVKHEDLQKLLFMVSYFFREVLDNGENQGNYVPDTFSW